MQVAPLRVCPLPQTVLLRPLAQTELRWRVARRASLTCNTLGHTLSGTQPSCSLGGSSTGLVACGEASCIVTGRPAPTNGALDAACAGQATLASGASCTLTCGTRSYTPSRAQLSCNSDGLSTGSAPSRAQSSCSLDSLSTGSVTCGEASCTVTSLPAPTNSDRDATCADQAIRW